MSKHDNCMTVTQPFLYTFFFDDRSQNRTSHDAVGERKTARNRVLTPFYQVVDVLLNLRAR